MPRCAVTQQTAARSAEMPLHRFAAAAMSERRAA